MSDQNITPRRPGMQLRQLITMLLAAEAQGATHVMVGVQKSPDHKECSGIDWVSMTPTTDGTVYIGTMDDWDYMSNEAMLTLDW